MSIVYSLAAINARLSGVVSTIDAGSSNGKLVLLAGGTIVSTITLAKPSAAVNGGVLTFIGPLSDPAAASTGNVTTAQVKDSNGNIIISGFSVAPTGGTADIIISNGLNSTLITAGQIIQVLAAQITGS